MRDLKTNLLPASKPLLLALVPSSWTVFSCRYPFSDCSNRFFSSFGRLRYTLLRLFFKFPPSVVPFSFRIVLRYRFLSSFGRLRYSSLRLFFKFLSFGPSIDIILRYRFLLRSSTVQFATSPCQGSFPSVQVSFYGTVLRLFFRFPLKFFRSQVLLNRDSQSQS